MEASSAAMISSAATSSAVMTKPIVRVRPTFTPTTPTHKAVRPTSVHVTQRAGVRNAAGRRVSRDVKRRRLNATSWPPPRLLGSATSTMDHDTRVPGWTRLVNQARQNSGQVLDLESTVHCKAIEAALASRSDSQIDAAQITSLMRKVRRPWAHTW